MTGDTSELLRELSVGAIMGAILISALGCFIAVMADVELRKGHLLIGAALYSLCSIPAMRLFRNMQFGWVSVLWAAMLVLAGVSVSVVVFHEPLCMRRIIAALLAIAAILLVH